jgi:hypothetical protein
MSIRITADPSRWLPLPSVFPTALDADEDAWVARILEGMRERWGDEWTPDAEQAVPQALRFGRSKIHPEDSITLQFWPTTSLANVVVHLAARVRDADEPRLRIPFDERETIVPPVIDAFPSAHLGIGVELRHLERIDTEPPMELGGISYLFENDTRSVLVVADPTLPILVGVMLDPLRAVVRSLHVVDDEGDGPWQPATIDESVLSESAEQWPMPDDTAASDLGGSR